MKVERLMTTRVETCQPDDSLERAAQIMWEHDCGCVPVVERDGATRAVGVVTDRDVCMAAYTQGRRLGEIRVRDAMTARVVCCTPKHSLKEAEQIMAEHKVRRLLVRGEDGKLLGVLSVADLAREAARQRGRSRRMVRDEEVADVLSSISAPRPVGPTTTQ